MSLALKEKSNSVSQATPSNAASSPTQAEVKTGADEGYRTVGDYTSPAPVMQAPANVGGLPATMPAMAPAASALQPDGGAPMPQPGQGGATAQ